MHGRVNVKTTQQHISVIFLFDLLVKGIMDLQEVGGGCEDWMELAQDRDRKWEGVVRTVMNLRVPKMRGISWLAAEPVSFSRRTLFHGVSNRSVYFSLHQWRLHYNMLVTEESSTDPVRKLTLWTESMGETCICACGKKGGSQYHFINWWLSLCCVFDNNTPTIIRIFSLTQLSIYHALTTRFGTCLHHNQDTV